MIATSTTERPKEIRPSYSPRSEGRNRQRPYFASDHSSVTPSSSGSSATSGKLDQIATAAANQAPKREAEIAPSYSPRATVS